MSNKIGFGFGTLLGSLSLFLVACAAGDTIMGDPTGGAQGSAGTSGAAGTTGAAREVARPAIRSARQAPWAAGRGGTTGFAGTTGGGLVTGNAGTIGSAGTTGFAGVSGQAGVSGAAGVSGVAGSSGTTTCGSAFEVNPNGFTKAPAAGGACWKGYAFAGGDVGSTIMPATFMACGAGCMLRMMGTVGPATATNSYAESPSSASISTRKRGQWRIRP